MDDFTSIWDHSYSFFDGDVKVAVHEDLDAGLGGTLFDGSVAMTEFLEQYVKEQGREYITQKTWVELGAGCGLPGLLMGVLGARIVLTDVGGPAIDLLNENIELNKITERAQARPLDWTSEEHIAGFKDESFDFILAADTIYSEASVEPFLRVCKALCHEQTKIIFSHPKARVPAASAKFWQIVGHDFVVEKVEPKRFIRNWKEDSKQFLNATQGVFILTPKKA